MNKLHLILTLSAFGFASTGYITSVKSTNFRIIYRIDGPSTGVCDLSITYECDNIGPELCKFTGTVNGVVYTNTQVYDASSIPCTVIRKRDP